MLVIDWQLNYGRWLLFKKKKVTYFGCKCLSNNTSWLLADLEIRAARQGGVCGRVLLRHLAYRLLLVFFCFDVWSKHGLEPLERCDSCAVMLWQGNWRCFVILLVWLVSFWCLFVNWFISDTVCEHEAWVWRKWDLHEAPRDVLSVSCWRIHLFTSECEAVLRNNDSCGDPLAPICSCIPLTSPASFCTILFLASFKDLRQISFCRE